MLNLKPLLKCKVYDIFTSFVNEKIIMLKYDQGSSFTSKYFKTFVASIEAGHVLNTVAIPRASWQIERYNRTILSSLFTVNHGLDERGWSAHISKLRWSLNNTVNKSTGRSPAEGAIGTIYNMGSRES